MEDIYDTGIETYFNIRVNGDLCIFKNRYTVVVCKKDILPFKGKN